MTQIFDYQQKTILVNKFLEYASNFKVSAQASSGNSKITLSVGKQDSFTINSTPRYERGLPNTKLFR